MHAYLRNFIFILIFVLSAIIILNFYVNNITKKQSYFQRNYVKAESITTINSFKNGKWRNLTDEQTKKLSVLGRYLFLYEDFPPVKTVKSYKILFWKYGFYANKRHMKHFGSKQVDSFKHCSVKNCKITIKDEDYSTADIIIFHMYRMRGLKDLPPAGLRPQQQIWAFFTDEPPYYTSVQGEKLPAYNGFFNWSITHRMDSDVPVPYGRTLIKSEGEEEEDFNVEKWIQSKKSDVFVAIMASRCAVLSHRWVYVREMQKYLKVDVYGKCGPLKCPGHFRRDCADLNKYMFYLAFENSNCDEYITEKLWWNAYHKNSIPIVMGAPKESYKNFLPPNSYINVEDFQTPLDLVNYINFLVANPTELAKYFQWKKHFKVVQEHGYFQSESFLYCRVCEALNYNKKETKVYSDLAQFWSIERDCRPPWDEL